MAKSLGDIFPAPDVLLALEPEDIAPLLLQYLNTESHGNWNRQNVMSPNGDLGRYAGKSYDKVKRTVSEAWMVLEREGLVVPDPEHYGLLWFVTKRGRSLQSRTDFEAYRKGRLLPNLSDPTLDTKVRPLFLRGDYDTAVFRAFKEVETRVRSAAGLPNTEIGTPLMRKAFDPDNGSLTDMEQVKAEREAVAHFFAGAIGLFKNPSSHRDVSYGPEEAATVIALANFLLWWVDTQELLRRKSKRTS